jgi:hypothetical protein
MDIENQTDMTRESGEYTIEGGKVNPDMKMEGTTWIKW